ncbi:MAG: ATP-binding protein [Actinoallomurus sp.]
MANDFSGEADSVMQAGSIHGDVYFSNARRPFPPPHQLPLGPNAFVNRRVDIDRLDAILETRARRERRLAAPVSTVTGAPGVGKTALALHWAHRVSSRFPDGALFVDLHGYGPGAMLAPEQALDLFLRALNVSADGIPDALDERAALFRSVLDGKRVLVLIDNASSSTQVRHLLPASPDCCTVVTSRSSLPSLVAREGAVRVTLDVLSAGESVQLLGELMGASRVNAEPANALRVVELCGYLPLALRIVAERAISRPRLSLAELIEELAGERYRLDALALEEDELSDTRAVFSWSYHALTSELRKVFRLLGTHSGPDIGVEAAAALTGSDAVVMRRQLRTLADAHLLQEEATNRFHLHDLVRIYSVERSFVEDGQEDRINAVRRLLTWYLLAADAGRRAILPYSASFPLVPAGGIAAIEGFESGPAAMRWFDAERLNLQALLRQASELAQLDIVWKLAIAVSGYLELGAYWTEWEETVEVGLAAAQTLGDRFGEAASLSILGDAAWRDGRPDEAIERYERTADIGHEIGVGWIEGFGLRGQGLINEERGHLDIASGLFEAALQVFRSSGLRRGEGMSLLSLGKCARTLGDLPTALSHGVTAVEIFEEIGDTWTVAWGGFDLGMSYVAAGRLTEALTVLRTAVEIFDDFGDRRCQAQSLALLGDVLRDSGEPGAAGDCWRRAADLLESLGDDQADELRARVEATGED